jgi:hypothetical protein
MRVWIVILSVGARHFKFARSLAAGLTPRYLASFRLRL